MPGEPRSFCPIHLSLEVFGDRWTLLILRDMIFGRKRHFRELLQSDERISSNILADRLEMLLEERILTRAEDARHKQKLTYSLTEKGLALIPVFVHIGAWGRRYLPVSEELGMRAALLEKGGPQMWKALTRELRQSHLGVPARRREKAPAARVASKLKTAHKSRATSKKRARSKQAQRR